MVWSTQISGKSSSTLWVIINTWESHHHTYFTTLYISPPYLSVNHVYFTTMFISPQCLFHLMFILPPCLFHHHTFFTIIFISLPCLFHFHWCLTMLITNINTLWRINALLKCDIMHICLISKLQPDLPNWRVETEPPFQQQRKVDQTETQIMFYGPALPPPQTKSRT